MEKNVFKVAILAAKLYSIMIAYVSFWYTVIIRDNVKAVEVIKSKCC